MAKVSDLWQRSERDAETGCLRWTGAHTPRGYGQIRIGGKNVAVHRLAYEQTRGRTRVHPGKHNYRPQWTRVPITQVSHMQERASRRIHKE